MAAGRRPLLPGVSRQAGALLLGLALGLPAHAFTTGETTFPDRATVAGSSLVVNGGGVRARAIIRAYAVALYLKAPQRSADKVLADGNPKRLAIVPLMSLTADQFADALLKGLDKNHDDAEMAALAPRIRELRASLGRIGTVKKGSYIHLDHLPGVGTRLTVNGQPQGKTIAGDDFYRALLRIWLGRKPTQDTLKDALLGRGRAD